MLLGMKPSHVFMDEAQDAEVPNPPTGDPSEAPKPTEAAETQTVVEDTPPVEESPAQAPAEGASADSAATEDKEEPEYWFGEQQVDVEVPQEIQAMLDDKGIDSTQLLSELFAKDGDFSISPEMRGKLDEAFGAVMVDGYLNLFKNQNAQTMSDHARTVEAEQAKLTASHTEFTEMVGGDEGWDKIVAFADTMEDAELEAFNSVMALGNEHWAAQKTVISALMDKMKADETVDEVTLLGNESSDNSRDIGGVEAKGWLTKDEYAHLMKTEQLYNPHTFRKDPVKQARVAHLDSLRIAGQRRERK